MWGSTAAQSSRCCARFAEAAGGKGAPYVPPLLLFLVLHIIFSGHTLEGQVSG